MSKDIIIVSGLPRSGTSLMMQMLKAAGMPLMHDGRRSADASNPLGYYEYEPVKRLKEDNTWLGQAQGKVLKVVSPLLQFLSLGYSYKVIFVQRDLTEVLASQRRMLQGQGKASSADQQLAVIYQQHLQEINVWLAAQLNFCLLEVEYQQFYINPLAQVKEIANFVDLPLGQEAMVKSIKPELYRNQAKNLNKLN